MITGELTGGAAKEEKSSGAGMYPADWWWAERQVNEILGSVIAALTANPPNRLPHKILPPAFRCKATQATSKDFKHPPVCLHFNETISDAVQFSLFPRPTHSSIKVVLPGCAASEMHAGHVKCIEGWLARCVAIVLFVVCSF